MKQGSIGSHAVPASMHAGWALALKRGFDVLVAGLALLAFLPLMLLIALGIRLAGPGPILYRGRRGGWRGKDFYILKFRTMVTNAEQLGGPTTGTNDPRVTSIGALLRRTKLDELPQFLNVLAGEMSIVGPRPEVLEYTARYVGEELLILSMRPGITDFASIEFADLDDRVGSVDPDQYFREHILPVKNALRVKYVKQWSLGLDLHLLFATARRVLRRIFSR